MAKRARTTQDAITTGWARAGHPLSEGGHKEPLRAGFTLIELAVVMAIVVILAALAVPALTGVARVSGEGAMRTTLRGLFASARVRATNNSAGYAAIRFQQDQATGRSYAIMLRQAPTDRSDEYYDILGCPNAPDGQPGEANWDRNAPTLTPCAFLSFIAVADIDPVLLPRGVELAAGDISADSELQQDAQKRIPGTTFTVVFSPSGQIVRKNVFVGQRGYQHDSSQPDPTKPPAHHDAVFFRSKPTAAPTLSPLTADELSGGPFLQPDTQIADVKTSQGSIWLYERQKRVDAGATPFTRYVQQAGTLIPLNAYTGAPVNAR